MLMLPAAALQQLRHTSIVIGGCNAVGFAITAALETHKITDLVGAGSFVAAAVSLSQKNGLFSSSNIATVFGSHPKLFLVNLSVMLWGSRLATFLFDRVLKVGEDKRLRKFFRTPGEGYLDASKSLFPVKLAFFWGIQAAWGILCMLPVSLLNAAPLTITHAATGVVSSNPLLAWKLLPSPAVGVLSILPVVGIFTGILLETIADQQKSRYRNDPRNDGHWCDQGLWKLCRYPNYFGEMLTWWSVYFSCLPAMLAMQSPLAPLLGLASPAFITFLLLKVSGVPLLEAKYKKEYGDNAEYKRYVENTPLLIPKLPFW